MRRAGGSSPQGRKLLGSQEAEDHRATKIDHACLLALLPAGVEMATRLTPDHHGSARQFLPPVCLVFGLGQQVADHALKQRGQLMQVLR